MFSGLAGAALLTILEALFNAFGTSVNDWLSRKRAEQTQRDLGAAKTISTINKETADAERHASDIAVNQPAVGAVVAGMERGDTF